MFLVLYKFVNKLAAVISVAAVMFCGCSEISQEAPAPTTVSQAEEKPYPVTVGSFVFNEQPQTVGSLSPAITEMICELGYSDKLIGRSSYCDYPENISEKAILGSAANPDADAVIAAAPQLLISQSPIAKKDIVSIEDAGTRVMILSAPISVEELYSCYNDIAAVFGGKISCAEAADDAMRPLSDSLRKAENSIESFVYIISPDLAAASDDTFAGNFFSNFGKNAAADVKDALTAEELSALDPEWLVIPQEIQEGLPEEVYSLDAYQSGRIIVLDSGDLERIERPTSRLSQTVDHILEQINAVKQRSDSGESGEDE